MIGANPAHPGYGVAVARKHLAGARTLADKRQLAMWALKLVRAADPGGIETRRDAEVLRRWLDLLNAADRVARARAGTGRTPSVSPAAATVRAIEEDAFGALALANHLRSASDAEVLYHRLAHGGEIGRRGEALRAAVEAECARRPGLVAQAGAC